MSQSAAHNSSSEQGAVSRRTVLAVGTTGAFAALVGQRVGGAGAAESSSESDDLWMKGHVVRQTTDASHVQMQLDDQIIDASARDFPPDWRFAEGDILAVNRESSEAFPFLVGAPQRHSDGTVTARMGNVDPQRERVVTARSDR